MVNPHSAFADRLSPSSGTGKGTVSAAGPVDEIQVTEVLSRLPASDLLSRLVKRWYEVSQVCLMPAHFLGEAVQSLQFIAGRLNHDVSNVAAEILCAKLKPFVIPPDTLSSGFPKLFTGSNLRLETIGLLSTTAGLAALKLPHSDPLFFIMYLARRSASCLLLTAGR